MQHEQAAAPTPEQRIEQLMHAYADDVLRTCYVYLSDVHLAEDAMQETFLKAFRSLSTFRSDSHIKTWLTSIAINTCKDMLRGRWFRFVDRKRSLDELPPASLSFEMQDDTLVREVMRLPQKYKAPILLCYYWDLSAAQAAQSLGIAPSTLYAHLKKAQKMLRTKLEGWYHETD